MAMAMQMMKRSMSRMLKQSIVDLCRTSLGTDGYMEIDGIVCITIGEEETEEIVVKVHEILGDEDDLPINIRRATPQQPPPRNVPPANQRGGRMNPQQPPQSSQHQSMANSQQANKAIYSQSPGKQNQGHHGSLHGQGRPPHSQGDAYKRQTSTPSKPSQQDAKKMPPIDEGIIKIEIESDDETIEPVTTTKGGKGRPSAGCVCTVCDLGLSSISALKIHMTDVHRALACEVCWLPFSLKSELDIHMKTHDKAANRQDKPSPSPRNDGGKADKKSDGGERFKCGVCGNTSDSHKVMVDHLRSGHEFQGCYTCMLCREYFPNKPTFTIHRKLSHPAAKDVFCQNCGVGLKNSEYDNHRKECGGADDAPAAPPPQKKGKKTKEDGEISGPPAKRQCSTPSQASGASNKGNKKGSGTQDKNQFECQICCLLLDSFQAYGMHVKNVHQRHVCPICAGTFQTSRAVQQHTARHTGNLPFTCEKCGLGSHTEDELKRHHIVSHNIQPGLFTCAQCDVLIGSKGDFLTHMADVHKVDYLWDEELEKYVVLEMEGEDEEGYDEDGEYMDEEGYVRNHGDFHDNGAGQHFADAGYDMDEDDPDYVDEGMDHDNLVVCNICELDMSSLQELKEHISKVHHAVVCEICWRPFLSQLELKEHHKQQHEHGQGSGVGAGSGGGTKASGSGAKETTPKSAAKQSPTVTTSSSPAPSRPRTPSNSRGAQKKPPIFKCGVCATLAEDRRGIVDHLKGSHEFLGCFTCMLCGEFFPNKPTFTIHRKLAHSDAKEMHCDSCGTGLYAHEYDEHVEECVGSGIDIKDAEWDGKKEKSEKK